jgi:hypothetical protein
MSYDFNLLPRDPGQSWRQVMEANERRVLEESDRALSPAARTRLEQIADRLQVHDPQLKRFTTERYIELTGMMTLASRCRCSRVSWQSRWRTGTPAWTPER